jgi:hypothetical protein
MTSQIERESELIGVLARFSIGSQDRLWWTDVQISRS